MGSSAGVISGTTIYTDHHRHACLSRNGSVIPADPYAEKQALFYKGRPSPPPSPQRQRQQQQQPYQIEAEYREENPPPAQQNHIPDLARLVAALQQDLSLPKSRTIHGRIVAAGLDGCPCLGNPLINLFRKARAVSDSRSVFEKIHNPDVVSWTSIISAYSQHGQSREAFELFKRMRMEGLEGNIVTLVTLLGACSSIGLLPEGRIIHGQIIYNCFEDSKQVANALITMYGKCGDLDAARHVLEEMQSPNIVSYTAMVSAYLHWNRPYDALHLFKQLQQQGMKANRVMLVEVLRACANAAALSEGKEIHKYIIDQRMDSDLMVGTALINMYGKCEFLKDAYQVFSQMTYRDVVCWNAMINAYAQHGDGDMAMQLYLKMEQSGTAANKSTVISILGACANSAAVVEGMAVHAHIVLCGFESDIVVESALVHLYGKCGAVKEASAIFDRMQKHNLVTWNAIIAAYVRYGLIKEAFKLFRQMEEEHVKPDAVTFVSILCACSYGSLVDQGCMFFVYMVQKYRLTPVLEHYCCMVDLLGRARKLEEAEDLCYTIPMRPDAAIWRALLSACRLHDDVKIGEHNTKYLFKSSSYT